MVIGRQTASCSRLLIDARGLGSRQITSPKSEPPAALAAGGQGYQVEEFIILFLLTLSRHIPLRIKCASLPQSFHRAPNQRNQWALAGLSLRKKETNHGA